MLNELIGLWSLLTLPERAEMDHLLTAKNQFWQPIPGPQAQALETKADVTFYGGAAGGGKTDLLLGLALTCHKRSIIFRREYPQLRAIEDRAIEIVGHRRGYNASGKIWNLPDGRRLELGAAARPGDEQKFQGRPHDLKAFDEIGHFTESQFRFLCGWLRSTDPGQRCRVVATGNPPASAEGAWVIRYWAPWLDEQHPNPAKSRELRWFAILDGAEIEVEDGAPFNHKDERITPTSRTFIPSRVEDNPYLLAAGYKTTLQALPEPLRAMLLEGCFGAMQEDDPWQIVPAAWAAAAQTRWTETPDGPMTALGVDVARGGRDKTVVTARHGPWFAMPQAFPGTATPDGPAVAALVAGMHESAAAVNIDVVGVGNSPYDCLRENGLPAVALNGAEKSTARDRSGKLGFANKRAEWWWRLREALDPDHGDGLSLPPDRELLADLCAARWKLGVRGVAVEAKEDIIARIGRSPDKGESLVYALADEAPQKRQVRKLRF